MDPSQRVDVLCSVNIDNAMMHVPPKRLNFLHHRIVAVETRKRIGVKKPLALHIEMRCVVAVILDVLMAPESALFPLAISVQELPNIGHLTRLDLGGYGTGGCRARGLTEPQTPTHFTFPTPTFSHPPTLLTFPTCS